LGKDAGKKLKPPTDEEFNRALAKRIYAPWSFLLVKKMWKKGEEPWET